MRWQDKRKQIVNSYKKLSDNTCGNSNCPPYELEHLLFFLYNKFDSKQKACDIFTKVEAEKNKLFVARSIGNLRISRPDLLSDVIIGSSPDAEEEFMAQVIHNYRGAYSESR